MVVLAQDGSESIVAELGEEAKTNYINAIQQLEKDLSTEYDFKAYTFGSELRESLDFEFTDKSTNISEVLSTTYDLYSNQNLGAVIIATDGIYNEGSNPVYSGAKISAPIYTIALGDTTARRDLTVKRVFNNRITYLGDKFSIQVDLLADNAAGTNSRLNIYKN